MIKLTPEMWQTILKITILDPDGWDTKGGNFQEDWNKPLTFDEFLNKASESTTTAFPADRFRMREIFLNNVFKYL